MSREKPDSGGGLSLQTLLISSLSAVAAAIVVPLFWQRGTIIATAMTPIVVALANEALRRPAQHISQVAPRVTRRTATGAAIRRFDPEAAHTRHPERVGARGAGPERFEPLPGYERNGATGVSEHDPFGLRQPPRRNWWRIGIATGAVAFLIGAGVVTASELALFGGSITGGNERTSLFGGREHRSRQDTTKQQDRQTTPQATPTPGTGATPTPTTTAEPTTTPAPTATPTPTTTAAPQASPTP